MSPIKVGVEELGQDKLAPLLKLKYNNAIADAVADLGKPEEIGTIFAGSKISPPGSLARTTRPTVMFTLATASNSHSGSRSKCVGRAAPAAY